MQLNEIQNRVPEYRVNASTLSTNKKDEACIGKELKAKWVDYGDKTVALFTEDNSTYWWFNFSDVQELTPLSHEGKRIAIGDEIDRGCGHWVTVHGYYWDGYEWVLVCHKRNDKNNCWSVWQEDINGHRIPTQEKEMTVAEVSEALGYNVKIVK